MLARTSETEQRVIIAVALPSCCQAEDIKDEVYMLTRTCESNNHRHCTTIVLSAKRAGGASGRVEMRTRNNPEGDGVNYEYEAIQIDK